ncbi:hypothetical protein [Rubrobacter aplysinae]|uniref:hypothetical protein n=1 Tax=Rubrobacter aplysinae TaxID=909625 RepID=UPI00064BA3E6|nr:hypothetical protein [Rubrobacter aplysinae]
MSRLTLGFGVVLVLTGVISYFAMGRQSVTALIPAFIGVPLSLAGLVSMQPRWRSYGLYAAAGLGLLLSLGALRGVFGLLGGAFSFAAVVNTILFVASVGFLALWVRNMWSPGK